MLEKWLTPWRLRVYPRAALVAVAIGFAGLVLQSQDLITPQGVPLGGDYPVFYAVGSLVWSGNCPAVFEVPAVNQAQADALGKEELDGYHAWVYPPYVAVMLAPLAMLPYLPSFLLYTGLMVGAVWTAVMFLGKVSPWIDRHRVTVFAAVLSFYPILRGVTGGQNTAVTLMLLCGATAMLARDRQGPAGALLGLLMFKPHFALPVIVMVGLARRWVAVAVSVAVSLGYFCLATAIFGSDWIGKWIQTIAHYRALESNVNGPNLVSFLGVAEQLLGPGNMLALVLAGTVSLAIAAGLCLEFWRRGRQGQSLTGPLGVAAAAIILISPHTQFYELGLLALPAALLADRDRLAAAPVVLGLWLVTWIHILFEAPLVQPLFFVAVCGYVVSLRLLRPPAGPDPVPE